MKIALFILMLPLVGCMQSHQNDSFVGKIKLPSGETVVIEEGMFEARSIGSFSIRLYEAALPGDEMTFFSSGLVLSRDGVIEKVDLVDITNDHQLEIIVIVRSVGSGGYISAYAFSIRNQQIILRSKIKDILANEDPIVALKKVTIPVSVDSVGRRKTSKPVNNP
ncbi:MAG: PliI family lysozyme inhibitor of I-type lysozyme [Candidatus Endonucleobacter bathymodioli]|uniref:PliI family lysozyme inhibitor of I-type lysozyme n=1 Tax=Candidatus Endonucleibacter bathymodioli TaxID=539814 RepID=A0AA90NL06_9GAMM|nr:PliI family lysozyme inhibitor of I-type lysozyme [Candidatus Endonucleobacter bathymodioli]